MKPDSDAEDIERVRKLRKARRLHAACQERLSTLPRTAFPGACPVTEVQGVLGGRNDLMLFDCNGRRAVFELFFSLSQVPQDLRLLEQCAADVRVAVLLDEAVDPGVAKECFRKRPRHFPYLWLRQVLEPANESMCLARLRQLVDLPQLQAQCEALLAYPAAAEVAHRLGERLRDTLAKLKAAPTSPESGRQPSGVEVLAALTTRAVMHLGFEARQVRPLFVWLRDGGVQWALTLLGYGLAPFPVTDLEHTFCVWSAGDCADYVLVMGQDYSCPHVVLGLSEILNQALKDMGMDPLPIRLHFTHTYGEMHGLGEDARSDGAPGSQPDPRTGQAID